MISFHGKIIRTNKQNINCERAKFGRWQKCHVTNSSKILELLQQEYLELDKNVSYQSFYTQTLYLSIKMTASAMTKYLLPLLTYIDHLWCIPFLKSWFAYRFYGEWSNLPLISVNWYLLRSEKNSAAIFNFFFCILVTTMHVISSCRKRERKQLEKATIYRPI